MQFNFGEVLLQAAPGGGGAMFPLLMGGMIVVMYFFMIRPQQKKAKEQKKFQENITVGEKIVTTSGIHGKIIRVNESEGTLVLEIDRNTNITVDTQAVSMEMSLAYKKRSGLPVETTSLVENK